jgi:hypothetical protein
MRHIAMFSSGAGSAMAAKRVALRYGTESLTLLFADVNGEDEDNYRFLREASAWVGGTLEVIDNGGKTIWDIFREQRFLGNSRIDPCSKFLKRVPMRKWLEAHCSPDDTRVYLGFDWTEEHRAIRAQGYWNPWTVENPLCWEPVMDKGDVLSCLQGASILPPALTRQGFPHANCGGGCVKAGIGQFRRLYRERPDTFAEWEQNESSIRDLLGNVTILRDRRQGQNRPLPLTELRIRLEAEPSLFKGEDYGACNCMSSEDDV